MEAVNVPLPTKKDFLYEGNNDTDNNVNTIGSRQYSFATTRQLFDKKPPLQSRLGRKLAERNLANQQNGHTPTTGQVKKSISYQSAVSPAALDTFYTPADYSTNFI